MGSLSPRVAYIRTIDEPDKGYEYTRYFLSSALNTTDTHILDIFLSDGIIPSPYPYGSFANIRRADLELRISDPHAATGAGKRLGERCGNAAMGVVISGEDDTHCQQLMLRDCDYIIDRWTTMSFAWYWATAWAGVLQHNVLINSKYNMSRHHDHSDRRLLDRYAGRAWKASSGAMHGNGGCYGCIRCGGKCKRGGCRVNPCVESGSAEWARLPVKGSIEWRNLSSEDSCFKMRIQRLPNQLPVKDMYTSIDMFSGD